MGKELLLSITNKYIFNASEYRLVMDYNDPQKSFIHRAFEKQSGTLNSSYALDSSLLLAVYKLTHTKRLTSETL